MDRRLFLNHGTRAALTAALLPTVVASCQPASDKSTTDNKSGAAPAAGVANSEAEPFALHEATVADLQDRMAKGTETARSMSEKYLARIKALNEAGPMLRAVI